MSTNFTYPIGSIASSNYGTYMTTTPITVNGTIYGSPYTNSTFSYNPSAINSILSIYNTSGTEIVRIDIDGSVQWNGPVDVTGAADALCKSLTLSVEIQSGIRKNTKAKIRDQLCEELISMAEEKGNLSAEDLRFFLRSAKIVEKLDSSFEE